jgi:hypothetical protein
MNNHQLDEKARFINPKSISLLFLFEKKIDIIHYLKETNRKLFITPDLFIISSHKD